MSKKHSVSPTQIEEMKSMVVDSVGPQIIANKYHIGVSTVHNYKRQFKAEGLQFESVRGRQPVTITPASVNPTGEVKHGASIQPKYQTPKAISAVSPQMHINTFIVNGIPINITDTAKGISINRTKNGITFDIKL